MDACLEVGQSEGVVCVDQDKGMREGLGDGDLESVLTDGLHLTSKGYSVSNGVLKNGWMELGNHFLIYSRSTWI